MSKAGHARLAAALFAAVALHALLFIFPSSTKLLQLQSSQGGLPVELIDLQQPADKTTDSEQQTSQVQPVSQTALKPHALPAKTRIKQTQAQATKASVSASVYPRDIASHKSAAKLQTNTPVVQTRVAYLPAGESLIKGGEKKPLNEALSTPSAIRSSAASSAGVTVPDDVRRRILAHVHYPRQARRYNWQGQTEFQFSIRQQGIQQIILLASSGYGILDRAARRGLESVEHIPLADGLYRMPVVFRLQ